MNANECTRAWMPCSSPPAQDQRTPAHGSQCLKDGWSCLAQQIRGAGLGLAVNLALAAFVSVPAPTYPGILVPVYPSNHVPSQANRRWAFLAAPCYRVRIELTSLHRIQLYPRTSSSSPHPRPICLSSLLLEASMSS